MEIEKTRETSWKIQLKNQNEKIELTSVEVSGEVRNIRLTLIKLNDVITIELSKEEFFNYLSLISAFKDVLIGEEQTILEESYVSEDSDNRDQQFEENSEIQNPEVIKANNNFGEAKSEELNPEEWDPW
jgi:hypothetical protein